MRLSAKEKRSGMGLFSLLSVIVGFSLALGSTLAFGAPGNGHGKLRDQIKVSDARGKKRGKMGKRIKKLAESDGTEMVDVIVRYKDKPGKAEKTRTAKLGAKNKRTYKKLKMRSLRVPAHKLEELANAEDVDYVTMDTPVTSLSRSAKKTARLPEQATANGLYDGSGVTVAVLDSGVANHADMNVQVSMDCTQPSAAGSQTLRDEFNSTSYNNSDGSMDWSGKSWIETGDNNSPSGGDIAVEVDYCPSSSSRCIEFDSDSGALNDTIEREMDLSGATSATLSFDYRLDYSGAEYVLEVSTDGGASWLSSPLAVYNTPAQVFGESIDLIII